MYQISNAILALLVLSPTTLPRANGNDVRERQLSQDQKITAPDFFLIGAMKCGTTSLNELFMEHPQICTQGTKEKHFFDHEYSYDLGTNSYSAMFNDCPNDQYTLDATPSYISEPNVPSRIRDTYTSNELAKKKFILILREPVARQFSQYEMRLRVCMKCLSWKGEYDSLYEKERCGRNCFKVSHNCSDPYKLKNCDFYTFKHWVTHGERNEILRGHYLQHIEQWLNFISRSQLFILNFDSLIENTTSVMKGMQSFLGLKKSWGDKVKLPVPGYEEPEAKLDCKTYDNLFNHFSKVNKELVDFINDDSLGKSSMEPPFPEFSETRYKCSGSSDASSKDEDVFGDLKMDGNVGEDDDDE